MNNFSTAMSGQTLAATATSQTFAFDAVAGALGNGEPDYLIYADSNNPGVVRVRTGGPNVVADANSMPILPGEKGAYSKAGATHIAVICASGAAQVQVFVGKGS